MLMRSIALVVFALTLAACSLTTPPPRPAPQPQPVPAPQPDEVPLPPPAEPSLPPPPLEPPPRVPPPPPSSSAVKEFHLGPASKALVAQAQSYQASGDFPVAISTIERALRIEPRNPLLWIELGKVHQAAGNYKQAESTARKALSLASSDLKAQSAAWQLVARALRAQGKNQEAQMADARAYALMPD